MCLKDRLPVMRSRERYPYACSLFKQRPGYDHVWYQSFSYTLSSVATLCFYFSSGLMGNEGDILYCRSCFWQPLCVCHDGYGHCRKRFSKSQLFISGFVIQDSRLCGDTYHGICKKFPLHAAELAYSLLPGILIYLG